MNFKTTISLVVLLGIAVGSLYLIRSQPAPPAVPSVEELRKGSTARDVLAQKLGEVRKIVCARPGKPDWVFEKTKADDAATPTWQMTAPSKLVVQLGEAERIARTVSGLQYEVSYKPGESGGVSAADAGLEPPQLTVTLTDQDGKSAAVEIGKAASEQSTYVRLAGSADICVANSNLRQLLKAKPVEYRDKQLWTFDANSVKRLEVVDRTDSAAPINYVFVSDGSKWMMQSPVAARASGKVAAAAQEIARLRAIQWVDDNPEKLGVYGLAPATLTVRATVERNVEPKKEDSVAGKDGEEKPADTPAEPPKVETTVHEIQIANRSPIGEETKVYVRVGDESVVGTMMKTAADKLKPVPTEWRDMLLTTANLSAATKLELSSSGGALAFTSKSGEWTLDADGSRAETSAITSLLDAAKNLRAVAFVDNPGAEIATMGFEKPQAELKATVPSEEGIERLTVGAYTDATSRQLVYVRRHDSTAVAKVKAADVAPFLQPPVAFRDRTIHDSGTGEIQKIVLARSSKHIAGKVALTLERSGGEWSMTSPVAAAVRADRVKKLVDAFTRLRAEAVLDGDGQPSAFGLEDPSMEITLTVQPPSEYRIEPTEGGPANDGENAGGETKPAKPVEVKAAPLTVKIAVGEHDGRIVAKRSDRPAIYSLSDALYADLSAELRTDALFTFDEKKVASFQIREGESTQKFERKGGKWVYGAEPDFPLDAKKVEDLLLRVRDLKTERYVAYDEASAAKFGLGQPAREVVVTFEDGTVAALQVSSQSSVTDADAGFYSRLKDHPEVFLLTQASIDRFRANLADLQ